MFGKRRDIVKYVKSLEHLLDYEGTYDDIYSMHGTFPQKQDQIPKLIGSAKEIIDGKASGTIVDMFGTDVMLCELPQPALRLGCGFLLRNGTPEGVPHYHHSVC